MSIQVPKGKKRIHLSGGPWRGKWIDVPQHMFRTMRFRVGEWCGQYISGKHNNWEWTNRVIQ